MREVAQLVEQRQMLKMRLELKRLFREYRNSCYNILKTQIKHLQQCYNLLNLLKTKWSLVRVQPYQA